MNEKIRVCYFPVGLMMSSMRMVSMFALSDHEFLQPLRKLA
jgi:hypothetical protein